MDKLGEILWFESLEEAIEDGDTESALQVVRAAIKLLKRNEAEQREKNDEEIERPRRLVAFDE
jgi:hypothetical protein